MNEMGWPPPAQGIEGPDWSGYRASFAKWVRKADAALIRQVQQDKGVDISDHRPENLQVIDRSLGPRFRDLVTRRRRDYESSTIAIGCYLGEVFVRNLGARWHVPNYLQTLAALVMAIVSPMKTERFVYVMVGHQRVYVLRVAREAIDRTAAEVSLFEFYQGWARTSSCLEASSVVD